MRRRKSNKTERIWFFYSKKYVYIGIWNTDSLEGIRNAGMLDEKTATSYLGEDVENGMYIG